MANIENLKEELSAWKARCSEANDQKTRKLLEKLEADEKKAEAESRVTRLIDEKNKIDEHMSEKEQFYKREMKELQVKNAELKDMIKDLELTLDAKLKAYQKSKEELQVDNKLPLQNINFVKSKPITNESNNGSPLDISYTCRVVINYPFVMQKGQAVVTFEDEEVAEKIINKNKHKLNVSSTMVEVKANPVHLQRTITFEVNMNISNRKMYVHNLPLNLPEETLKDKLELTFYKSAIGGGEVQSIECDRSSNSACITFLQNGVVERLLKKKQHLFSASGSAYKVTVKPCIELQLNKLQLFTGICPRSVLLSEIKNTDESEEDMQDLIMVHFQKPSNGGGEVTDIAYSMEKSRILHFEQDNS
ncbi:N-myc-interactor [Rhinophrynus dorsalis]